MRNPLSMSAAQPRRRTPRRSLPGRRAGLLLALVALLQGAPLLADEVDAAVRANATSAPQDAIPWMSGGIGDDARDSMRDAAKAYNVHLVFSDRHGSYLAGIPFKVARRNGALLYSGVSEGPLLYLKLPPGVYQISAELAGEWQSKRVQAGAAGRSARTVFVAKGE